MWDKNKWKLIYAYIISPLLIMSNIGGSVIIELYGKQGDKAIQRILSNNLLSEINLMSFKLGLFSYLPVMLPPTLIRFVALQRKLKYGVEISVFFSLSLFISLLSCYFLTNEMLLTFGLLNTLIMYCILSYQSLEYSEEWNSYTFHPIVFMLVALALMTFISGIMTEQKQWYLPIWEAIFACCVLTRHKDKTIPAQPEQHSEIPHREARQEPEKPSQSADTQEPDTADTLIDIGLAHIGRITALDNPYITPEQTQSRHNVERPFLQMLSERYMDNDTRKALARHFMLYKEVTLFVIFAMVLKNDKPLLTKIHNRLKVLLSQGLPSKVIASRNEYWHKLSEKFHENYIRTHDLATTLDYVFWSVLPENLKGEGFADLTGNGYLKQIFDYAREAIAQEYKNIAR